MKAWSLAAAVLCCAVSSVYGQAAEGQPLPGAPAAAVKAVNLNLWTVGTYHPDYTGYCYTCYGGSGCGNRGRVNGPGCGVDIWGVECPCWKPGIQTCRKCGLFGRIFFYECRRLACGQEGGQGCSWKNDCGSCGGCGECSACNSCGTCGGCQKGLLNHGLLSWLEDFRARPLGGTASLSGPYTSRFNAYGWREGPMTYMGQCGGSYESYLHGPYDARGPLNGNASRHHTASMAPTFEADASEPAPGSPVEAPAVPKTSLRKAPALKSAPRVSYAR